MKNFEEKSHINTKAVVIITIWPCSHGPLTPGQETDPPGNEKLLCSLKNFQKGRMASQGQWSLGEGSGMW